MAPVQILRRAATPADLNLLFELHRAALRPQVELNFGPWDDDVQRKRFRETTDLATHEVLIDGDRVIGFWSVTRSNTEIYLERLSLLPEFQNGGIGTSLVGELIQEARATSRQLKLRTFVTNPARRLYDRLGFRATHVTDAHVHMELGGPGVEIVYLADHLAAVPLVAGWWIEAWGHERPDRSLESLTQDLRSRVGRDRLPIQLLAMVKDSVVGVAALKPHELVDVIPELHNWLGSVYVEPAWRGHGIASALVLRVMDVARSLGITTIHLQTEVLDGGLYARLGWKPVTTLVHEGLERVVMVRSVVPSSASL